jgi:hypothetical protein
LRSLGNLIVICSSDFIFILFSCVFDYDFVGFFVNTKYLVLIVCGYIGEANFLMLVFYCLQMFYELSD